MVVHAVQVALQDPLMVVQVQKVAVESAAVVKLVVVELAALAN